MDEPTVSNPEQQQEEQFQEKQQEPQQQENSSQEQEVKQQQEQNTSENIVVQENNTEIEKEETPVDLKVSEVNNNGNDNPQYQNDIIAYVVDPVIKDNIKNYVVYTVKGQDYDGPFEILRRYSDFLALKESLQVRWPGCYVPPVPSKKSVGNFDHIFVEDRRKQLEYFIQQLAELKHLWYGEEMKIFLRTGCNDIESALQTLPKITYESLIKKYEQSFYYLSGKEINTDIIVKISTFLNYLKKQQPLLENYKQLAKNMIKQRKQHNEALDVFLSIILPDYEKNSLTEYLSQDTDGKLVMYDTNSDKINELQLKFKDFVNDPEFDEIYNMLRIEIKELQAFNETLSIRSHYETLKSKSFKKKIRIK